VQAEQERVQAGQEPRPYISGDDGPASSGGASKTQLVHVTCPDGSIYEAHTKFAEGAENGTRGLASEFLASRLAASIGANVPTVAVVVLLPGQVIRLRDGVLPAPGLAAASETIPNWVDVNAGDALEGVATDQLALLAAVQWWVEASDRGHNVILTHGRAYSIDFASAFGAAWSGAPPPSVLMDDPLLLGRLTAEPLVVRSAAQKLLQVSDNEIDRAVNEVPDEWMDVTTKARFQSHLKANRQLVAQLIETRYI
jgi:hypothetical protein